jgi:hypothetical protein
MAARTAPAATAAAAIAPLDDELHAELFNEQHLLDAHRMADAFGTDVRTIAEALGRPYDSVRRRPAAQSLQDGLARLYAIYADLLDVFDGDAGNVKRWLNAPNRRLQDRARPVTYLRADRVGVLAAVAEAMKARQPV